MYLKDCLSHQVEKQNKKSLSHSKIVEVRRIWRGTPEIILTILLHSDLSTLNYQKQNLSHTLTSPHLTTPHEWLKSTPPTIQFNQTLISQTFWNSPPKPSLFNNFHSWKYVERWRWRWRWWWYLLGKEGEIWIQRNRCDLRLGFDPGPPFEDLRRFVRLSPMEFPRLPCRFSQCVCSFIFMASMSFNSSYSLRFFLSGMCSCFC